MKPITSIIKSIKARFKKAYLKQPRWNITCAEPMPLDKVRLPDGKEYRSQPAGVQMSGYEEGCEYPICIITKQPDNSIQIDLFMKVRYYLTHDCVAHKYENKPTHRIISYPSGLSYQYPLTTEDK